MYEVWRVVCDVKYLYAMSTMRAHSVMHVLCIISIIYNMCVRDMHVLFVWCV